MRNSAAVASVTTVRVTRGAWWEPLRDANDMPVDPIVWAPWKLLCSEAQIGVDTQGRWMIHVPSLALITWADHRDKRQAMIVKYQSGLARLQRSGADEVARRRALTAMAYPQSILGVLRALELLAGIVPARIVVQVSLPGAARQTGWRHARLAGTAQPAIIEA